MEKKKFNKKYLFLIVLIIGLVLFIVPKLSKNNIEEEIDVENPDFSHNTIYQIVTDRFFDGDSSNNPTGDIFDTENDRKYHGGDWKGIEEKIKDGYLRDLGISAIWISSPVENIDSIDPSNNSASYHGYWGKDYFRPNPYFGTIEDFKDLVDTAHENNIKIIIDFVPNHTSTVEPYDLNYPEDGALYKDGNLVGSYSEDEKDIFHNEDSTNYSTYENGIYHKIHGLADLNHLNPIVDEYMKDSIDMWLDLGVDGIRVDAVKHMAPGWQKNWVSSIYENKNVFVFGEWFHDSDKEDPLMTKFKNESGMSLLDFRFAYSVRDLVAKGPYNMEDFYKMIEDTEKNYKNTNDLVTFVDNHDISRIYSRTYNEDKVNIAHVLLMTSRGVPTIYYGSEHYMEGGNDPENRKDLVDFSKDSDSYKIISKLANLRKSTDSLAFGDTIKKWINEDVLIFERVFEGETTLIAINLSEEESYKIDGLETSLKKGSYKDKLDGIQNGFNIKVKDNKKVESFEIQPLTAALWHENSENDNTVIGNITPKIGLPGNTITITGRNFGDEEKSLKISGKETEITTWKNKRIDFLIPEIEPGIGEIVLELDGENIEVGNIEILTNSQIPVRIFATDCETEPGENIYIVGNVEELGNFQEEKAIGPFFNSTESIAEYPNWFYDISLPKNEKIEYKFIKKDKNGKITWEKGENKTFNTGEKAMEEKSSWEK